MNDIELDSILNNEKGIAYFQDTFDAMVNIDRVIELARQHKNERTETLKREEEERIRELKEFEDEKKQMKANLKNKTIPELQSIIEDFEQGYDDYGLLFYAKELLNKKEEEIARELKELEDEKKQIKDNLNKKTNAELQSLIDNFDEEFGDYTELRYAKEILGKKKWSINIEDLLTLVTKLYNTNIIYLHF